MPVAREGSGNEHIAGDLGLGGAMSFFTSTKHFVASNCTGISAIVFSSFLVDADNDQCMKPDNHFSSDMICVMLILNFFITVAFSDLRIHLRSLRSRI